MFRIALLLIMVSTAFGHHSWKRERKQVTFPLENNLSKRRLDTPSKFARNQFALYSLFTGKKEQPHGNEGDAGLNDIPQSNGFVSLSIESYTLKRVGGKVKDDGVPVMYGNRATDPRKPMKRRQWLNYTQRRRKQHRARKRIYIPPVSHSKPSISAFDMRKYPYVNIVKLSTGCLGTLLTPHHVLTSAHCVHDGEQFKDNIEMLKIQVLSAVGHRIHYIVKISVPVMWMRAQTLPEVSRGAYDYAVLDLNLPVQGRDKFMQLSLPTVILLNSDMHFLGFSPNRPRALMKSSCSADESLVSMARNVMLTECDTAKDNSGAAIFSENAREGDKIIGVLSNSVTVQPDQPNASYRKYESIMLLTLPKCLEICAMIYPDTKWQDVCATVRKHNIEYLHVALNRIMPFFG